MKLKFIIKSLSQMKIFGDITKLVWHQFLHDACFTKAASLAYTTLLSLVPLLAVSFSVLSAFPVFNDLQKNIQDLIFANFIIAPAANLQQYVQIFVHQVQNLSVFGVLFLFVTAVLLIFGMEQIFNQIWRIEKNRHGVTAFLLFWAVITLIPLVIAVILALYLTFASSLAVMGTSYTLLILGRAFLYAVPFLAVFSAFALLYIALPNCSVPFGSALIASLVATTLFELARKVFSLYVVHIANYNLIYGALAIIPIFLVWLYISWVVILFGVVVNYILANYEFKKSWLKF